MTDTKSLKAVGIVAEYNPFHNGHKYHLEQSMAKTGADLAVAVMSGTFTQRGEAALLDKWTRAEMAVRNGVNLVVEMPVLFACNNAGYFGRAGVEILESLGVDWISFGSESGNVEELSRISRGISENEEHLEKIIKMAVKSGLSYPRARQEALYDVFGDECEAIIKVIENPNNILALEYLKNMKTAKPVAIKREGAGYNQVEASGGFASASGIRKMLEAGEDISPYVSEITREMLEANKDKLVSQKIFFDLLRQKIFMHEAIELNNIFGAEEGLGSIMKNNVRHWKTYEDMVEGLKSKRYTRTRINRVLVHTLLEIIRRDVINAKNYIRVLAFDDKGSAYLKQIKKAGTSSLPVITNINKEIGGNEEILPTLKKDISASDLYNLASDRDLYEYSEYIRQPFKL